MSEFLYDKAIMALKAQRYDEAQSSYEQALQVGYSVEAWTGLGVCKMFQIAEGQTMEEVLYCFEKARAVEGADKREIDLKLLQYAQVVIMQCGSYAIAAIKNAIVAEKKANTAALISIASIAVGGLSNSTGTKILAGAAAATSAGVAIGQFGKMTSSKDIGKFATDLLQSIYNNVYGFLLEKEKMEEAAELKETTDRLCNEIIDSIPGAKEKIENENKLNAELNEARNLIENHPDKDVSELAKSLNYFKLKKKMTGFNVKAKTILECKEVDKPGNDLSTKELNSIAAGDYLFTINNFLGASEYHFTSLGVCQKKGLFKLKYVLIKYNDIEQIEKTSIGDYIELIDKKSGLKLNIRYIENQADGSVEDWCSPIISFIKSKQY